MSMRVHDLAAEFGVASDELMKLLREMDIFVRSHLSALEEDKISRIRAGDAVRVAWRWGFCGGCPQ